MLNEPVRKYIINKEKVYPDLDLSVTMINGQGFEFKHAKNQGY